MTVGYPDYARLSQQGGTELYGVANTAPPYFSKLFQGYVGAWPYVNIFTNLAASADTMQIVLAYCSDATFNTIVGERTIVRTGGNVAVSQYANLTPWLTFWYTTKSGNPMTFNQLSVYANIGDASQIELIDNTGPIFQFDSTVPASSTGTENIQAVQPGDAILIWDTSAAAFEIDLNGYSWATNAYNRILTIKSGTFAAQGTIECPMLDTPYQFLLKNNDTAARTFNINYMSR